MNKISQISRALIMISALFCIPANASALSFLDTKFSVQIHGRKQQLQCDFLNISNGKLNCTNGGAVVHFPLSRIKQLDFEYMGKPYYASDINTNDINMLNTISAKKEEAFSRQKKSNQQEISSSGREGNLLETHFGKLSDSKEKMGRRPLLLETISAEPLKDIPNDHKKAKSGWLTGWFGPSNYFECILDKMPGVKNDTAANAVIRLCRNKFPDRSKVKKKSPIIGIKNGSECVFKYAKDVTSPRGAKLIQAACYKLYPRK